MKEKVPKYRKNAYRMRMWKFTVEYFWTLYCRFLFIIPWTLQRYEPGRAIVTSRAFSRNLLCPFRSVMITKISVFLQAIFKQISINPFTFRWIAPKGDQRYFSGIGKGGIFFDNRRTYCLDPEVLTTLSPKVKKNDDKSLQSGHGIRTLICRPEMGAQQHSCSRQPVSRKRLKSDHIIRTSLFYRLHGEELSYRTTAEWWTVPYSPALRSRKNGNKLEKSVFFRKTSVFMQLFSRILNCTAAGIYYSQHGSYERS